MRPSKIINVKCMDELKACQEGSAIRRPSTGGSFEIYVGQVFNPGASCCPGRYDPVVIRKEKGAFFETQIMEWFQLPEKLEQGKQYITGWSQVRKILPEEEKHREYNELWDEIIRK